MERTDRRPCLSLLLALFLPICMPLGAGELKSELPLVVWERAASGEVRRLGRTPGAVAVPESSNWYVSPRRTLSIQKLIDEVAAKEIPGLLLSGDAWSEEDLQRLGEAKGLRSLYLIDCSHLSTDVWKGLGGLSELETLYVGSHSRNAGLRDEDVALMAELTALRTLNLFNGFDLTDACLESLASLPRLEALAMTNAGIGDDGLRALREKSRLRTVNFYNCWDIGDAGAKHLATCDGLETVGLNNTGLTDEGLRHLAGLKRLRRLGVGGSGVTDAGLEILRSCPRLAWLNLEMTDITDRGLALLAKFPALERLELQGVEALTDEGLTELVGLKTLSVLDLTACTGITDEAVRRFEKKRPECTVIR